MQKILFIELLGGLGDVLIALPVIQALGASHPQAQMTVLTFSPGDVLLCHHPLVHRLLVAEKAKHDRRCMRHYRNLTTWW
jgi:ADP-heptose:LPS heptosyltransferase